MKTVIVLSAIVVAVFGSFVDDINWKNVKQADQEQSGAPGPDVSIQGRILGGNVAKPHHFPYQVLLDMVKYSKDHKDPIIELCGGCLISKNFVLTAGHCALGKSKARVFLAPRLKSNPENHHAMIEVSSKHMFVHPLYDLSKYENDIALIRLPAKVHLNHFVQTIKLPRPTMLQAQLEGHMVILSGWGKNGNSGRTSNELLYANLRVLPESKCTVAFPNIFRINSSNICVSGNVQSICPGDSGDPLVAKEAHGTNVVVGIASYVSGGGCEKGFPTVFTRVTSFLDWISRKTGIAIRH